VPASNDPTKANDLALIATLAEQLGLSRFGSDDETVIKVGDWEIQYAVAVRNGVHLVEEIDRGYHKTIGTFATEAEARQFLIMELAISVRSPEPAPARTAIVTPSISAVSRLPNPVRSSPVSLTLTVRPSLPEHL
jgi:hypothetical protein